jgi:hypothetical protein
VALLRALAFTQRPKIDHPLGPLLPQQFPLELYRLRCIKNSKTENIAKNPLFPDFYNLNFGTPSFNVRFLQ